MIMNSKLFKQAIYEYTVMIEIVQIRTDSLTPVDKLLFNQLFICKNLFYKFP